MPGSSLWLIPPESHPLHGTITSLIASVLPSNFPTEAGGDGGTSPVLFAPHMTLTSEILPSTYGGDSGPSEKEREEEKQRAQEWLDTLPLPPASHVRVRLESVDTQDIFFRRCFIRVGYDGVKEIVGVAREHGVVRGGVGGGSTASSGQDTHGQPGTISQTTEEWLAWWKEAYGPHVSLIYGSTPITDEKLSQISKTVEEAGVKLGASAATLTDSTTEEGAGWEGGMVWLVPTDRPIAEWKPIATRLL
ncbi:2',3'-cyclic-nucleotide 3'-phosphodiesterase [Microdochium trichocladiopsis]|uniref:2',3'-cyclic-nucleotide 3'-phosphodiesterase n=1 Tax=Microdochium trichocladiopsis TaxID=1682393 RepID=A0A9P9BKW2_9PEZI|nr:2',3'-cyclic-nucleotide 3'-phosphodiesterase [Microdochium trichocladiopsis]KAH7021027.1 2',3'-cyclic-nucleotide 3'-phosphodiesterase [Microdochium trichocladiopsis]